MRSYRRRIRRRNRLCKRERRECLFFFITRLLPCHAVRTYAEGRRRRRRSGGEGNSGIRNPEDRNFSRGRGTLWYEGNVKIKVGRERMKIKHHELMIFIRVLVSSFVLNVVALPVHSRAYSFCCSLLNSKAKARWRVGGWREGFSV